MPAKIRHKNIPRAIHRNIPRRDHLGFRRVSCNRCDHSIRSDFADPRVAQVRDINGAGIVGSDAVRKVQRGKRGRSAIAREPGTPGAREGSGQAIGSNPADTMRIRIREIEIAQRIHRDAGKA